MRERALRRLALKAQGITPTIRVLVWSVQPAYGVPAWAMARAVAGLTSPPHRVWLSPGDAKRLLREDRGKGGRPQVLTTELRHCEMCARPLIAEEAAKRRVLVEACHRTEPCGPHCAEDRESRLWRKQAPDFRVLKAA